MSYSPTSTMSKGRNLPISKKSWLIMAAVTAVVIAIFLTWMLAGGGSDSFSSDHSGGFSGGFNEGFDGESVPAIAPAPAGAPSRFSGDSLISVTVTNEVARNSKADAAFASSGGARTLATIQRQIISQGSVSVEVPDVATASARVRAIAEGVGGFVEQLSSSGVDEFQQSTLTVRVPQDEFFSIFEEIKALGKVQNENAGSEDVTERFIDLEARLKSAQREEASLLSLLDRAENVSEILIIERELSRVRTELEQVQGQLNFLERRVDLATITVFLSPPQRNDAQAPSGSLSVETADVSDSVAAVKAIVSQVNGKVDQVFTSVQDGRQRANMTVRVFSDDFNLLVAAVEDQGGLVSKEIREGREGDPISPRTDSDEPNARLDIVFEAEESSNLGRDLAIYIPLGSLGLLVLLALISIGAYRMGVRRED